MADSVRPLDQWQAEVTRRVRLYRNHRGRRWTLAELRETYPYLQVPTGALGLKDMTEFQREHLLDQLLLFALIPQAIAFDLGLAGMFGVGPSNVLPGFAGDWQQATFDQQ